MPESIETLEAPAELVEPVPIPQTVIEDIEPEPEPDPAEQSASLRDLPDDIWQVRRARVRRPIRSEDDDAPGRIRFAEDIAGLRGGVTASRRNRRRPDSQQPGGGNRRRRPPRRRR